MLYMKWPPCGFGVAACLSFFSSVLEKPSQTAVAKLGCVCENTHLSPADGSFPGHTVPPATLPSRAWPSQQPAQQATGITSPCWQDPFYGLSVRNTSSNTGQYPIFPWPLQSTLSIPVSDTSVATMQNYSVLVVPSFLLLSINSRYESAALKYRVGEMRQNCLEMVMKWAAGLAFYFFILIFFYVSLYIEEPTHVHVAPIY